jgi:hypothetical protein
MTVLKSRTLRILSITVGLRSMVLAYTTTFAALPPHPGCTNETCSNQARNPATFFVEREGSR